MGSHSLRHKVLLPQLKMIVLILMTLLTCGKGQQIPPPSDGNTLILMNVVKTLDSLSLQLKEFQVKVEAKFEEIQGKISAIDESQKSLFRNMEGLQQCSTKAQLSQFQELVFKDPCEDGSHNCSDMSTCTDYVNRYECSCLPGYSGDGFTCQGPVCESSNSSLFVPEIGCLTIVEEFLIWDEGESKCQETGGRLAEGLQPSHIQALSDHFLPMMSGNLILWVGLRHRQWIHQEEEEEIKEEDWFAGQPNGDPEECGYIRLSPSLLGLGDDRCSYSHFLLCQSLP